MIMLVEFYRAGDGRLCGWIAAPPLRLGSATILPV